MRFINHWLIREGPAYYSWCRPWVDGVGWSKKAGWGSHGDQASRWYTPMSSVSIPDSKFLPGVPEPDGLKSPMMKKTRSSPCFFWSMCFITAKEIVTKIVYYSGIIWSGNLCHLIGEFRYFTFNITINVVRRLSTTLLFVFCLSCVSFVFLSDFSFFFCIS